MPRVILETHQMGYSSLSSAAKEGSGGGAGVSELYTSCGTFLEDKKEFKFDQISQDSRSTTFFHLAVTYLLTLWSYFLNAMN